MYTGIAASDGWSNDTMPKRTLYRSERGEYIEKKSRFIADLFYVSSPEEADSALAAVRKEFYDARHHCSAYICMDGERLIKHASDDGEPQGTAGRPMLDVLENEGLVNCLAVVTRYFGGTLLGTGGLVRSYTKALQDAIERSEIIERRIGIPLTVTVGYDFAGKLEYFASSRQLAVLSKDYGQEVSYCLLVPEEDAGRTQKAIAELTAGRAHVTAGDRTEYAVLGGQVLTGEALRIQ